MCDYEPSDIVVFVQSVCNIPPVGEWGPGGGLVPVPSPAAGGLGAEGDSGPCYVMWSRGQLAPVFTWKCHTV